MRLTHVRLLVDDFASCFRFYRDVLGLEVAFGEEAGPYASFRSGDAALSIFARPEQGEAVPLREPGDGAIPIVEARDLDGEAERLRPHVVAGPISRPDWGIRVLYVRDPAGNLLELYNDLAG